MLVLRRGADPRVPDELMGEAESVWHSGFKAYANAHGRLTDEKTVGLYRRTATHGPR